MPRHKWISTRHTKYVDFTNSHCPLCHYIGETLSLYNQEAVGYGGCQHSFRRYCAAHDFVHRHPTNLITRKEHVIAAGEIGGYFLDIVGPFALETIPRHV